MRHLVIVEVEADESDFDANPVSGILHRMDSDRERVGVWASWPLGPTGAYGIVESEHGTITIRITGVEPAGPDREG